MGNSKGMLDRFAKNVGYLKSSIVRDYKEIEKLRKQMELAASPADRDGIKHQIDRHRINLEKSRLALDDLTCAFVRRNPYNSSKILKHYGYQTSEGFLEDRDSYDKPSLTQSIDIITNNKISLFYPDRNYKIVGLTPPYHEIHRIDRSSKDDKYRRDLESSTMDEVTGINVIRNAVEEGIKHR
jgi:hypothetical protein